MTDTNTTGTDPGTAGLAHDYLDLDSLFSAEELALRAKSVHRHRGARVNHQTGTGNQLPRADQCRPSVAAELCGISIAVDDAALLLQWNQPVRGRRIRPDFEHTDDGRPHSCAGDIGDDDLRRRAKFRELQRKRWYLGQKHVPRLEAVLARVATRAVSEQSPFQERVADVDQQIVVGHADGRSGRHGQPFELQSGSSG